MDRGDEMRKGAEPSAVRLLPAAGTGPTDSAPPPSDRPRSWMVPFLVVGGVAAVFLLATRPAGPSNEAAASTTQPPPLAAVAAEEIDLATQPGNALEEWFEVPFEWTGQINDVVRASSSFVAVGSTPEGAQAWYSGTGASWREVVVLEVPETANASLDHAVQWNGDVVVLGSVEDGVGLWTAFTVSNWVYQGRIESMGSASIKGVAAGSELLAVSEREGQVEGWMSSDGLEWRSLGQLSGLEGAHIASVTANENWYFAAGQDSDGQLRRPAVYRSADGVSWESVAGEIAGSLTATEGMITDITASPDGVLAVGWTIEFDGAVVAVWRSADGVTWERVGQNASSLRPTSMTVEVRTATSGANPRAEIAIDGVVHEVTVGSEIITDAGRLAVIEVTDSSLLLSSGVSRQRIASFIEVGEDVTTVVGGRPGQIVAEGPRIAITGFVTDGQAQSPAIWSSTDSGLTWNRTTTRNGEGPLTHAVMAGSNIVAFGDTAAGEPTVWRTSWVTEAVRTAAGEKLEAYLGALDAHDLYALVKLLPPVRAGSAAPRFQIPSLGNISHDWWDSETGALDIDRVAATVEYLAATNTSIEIADCTVSVSLGRVDRTTVTCGFEVDSTLLTTLGYEDGSGVIKATVVDGSLDSTTLRGSPTVQMWNTLGSGLGGASDSDRATLLASTETGQSMLSPTFNGATAATHMRLAETFVAGLLRPGDTRIIETSLGAIEWSWIDPLDLPVDSFDSVTWSEFGFLATARSRTDEYGSASLTIWTSLDGWEWSELAAPQDLDGLWNLQPFLDGVAGYAWVHEEQFIVYFDGLEWLEIRLPGEANEHQTLMSMAAGGDRILAIGGSRGEESGPVFDTAWLIGSDLIPRQVDLPPQDDWEDVNLGLVGNEDGFLVSISGYYETAEISIWRTTDGTDWRLVADTAQIDDARFVHNLQEHRTRYFVVGEGLELRCFDTADGEWCGAVGLWTSPDGVAWDRALTENGEPLAAYQIGSGDLGLVAFGEDYGTNPRSVYLSADGETWEQAGNLSLLHPDAEWWWLNQAAVSKDTIVVPGAAYTEGAVDYGTPFLIVGRVIDE